MFVPTKPPPRIVIKPFNPSSISVETPSNTVALSKTTYYRHLKKGVTSKGKRSYTCKKCNKGMIFPSPPVLREKVLKRHPNVQRMAGGSKGIFQENEIVF